MLGQVGTAPQHVFFQGRVLRTRDHQPGGVGKARDIAEVIVQAFQLVHQRARRPRLLADSDCARPLHRLNKRERVGERRDTRQPLREHQRLIDGAPLRQTLDDTELESQQLTDRNEILAAAVEEKFTGFLRTASHRPERELEHALPMDDRYRARHAGPDVEPAFQRRAHRRLTHGPVVQAQSRQSRMPTGFKPCISWISRSYQLATWVEGVSDGKESPVS